MWSSYVWLSRKSASLSDLIEKLLGRARERHLSLLRSALDVGCESSLVSRSPHPSRNSSHKLA